jgi:hypothetical protein
VLEQHGKPVDISQTDSPVSQLLGLRKLMALRYDIGNHPCIIFS